MKLPLVDEVREARRLAEEAQQASVHLHRIDSALVSIDVMERQLSGRAGVDGRIPGGEVLEELQEAWPQLADLASHASREAEPIAQQLHTRRGQLQLAKQVLRPLAADAEARGKALHQLQHEQRHLLEAPRYADDVAELAELGAERERLSAELLPLNQRLALVQPAQDLLQTFITKLARSHPEGPDPLGVFAWRTAYLAQTFLQSLEEVMQQRALEVPLPGPPQVASEPDPDPEVCARYRAEAQRIGDALNELRAILADEGASLLSQRDARQQRHDELTQRILERMG